MTLCKMLPQIERERKRQSQEVLTPSPRGEGRDEGERIVHKQKFVLIVLLLLAFQLNGCVSSKPSAPPAPRTKAVDIPPFTEQQGQSLRESAKSIAVEFLAPWTEKEITLLRAAGPAVKIKASYTYAKVTGKEGTRYCPQLAFVCPDTGNTWIGPEYPVYVETSTGLYGLKATGGLRWYECTVVKEYAFKLPLFDDLLLRYQNEAAHFYVISENAAFYYPSDVIDSDFFIIASNGGVLIPHASLTAGILQVDMVNSPFRATLWIDVRSREIIRAVRDGKQLFPIASPPNESHVGL